jgi:site-specific DNA-methyltransferase (adenine-specific)
MSPVVIGNAVLYLGDCREILPELAQCQLCEGSGWVVPMGAPDQICWDCGGTGITRFVVITDPPWDQAKGIPGADDPRGLFAAVAPAISKSRCAAIQLGCYTDPCFCSPLAALMPYLHTCWLRYIPPSYNGRILVEADVAYVYGKAPQSAPGRRVLPATVQSTAREPSERDFLKRHGRNRTSKESAATIAAQKHPMPRVLKHVRWLVEWHSDASETICDPFMGSGTAGVAAADLGRPFIGIEIDQNYFDLACERIEQAQRQQRIA